jgi:hypothetical protein
MARQFMDVQKREAPDVLFLSETKHDGKWMEWLRWKLGASLGGLLPRLQHELQLEPSQTGIPWTVPGSEPLESCSLEQFSPHGAAKH